MGDSLELSHDCAVNGVPLNTDNTCVNNGAGDHCTPTAPSSDLLGMKKLDVSDNRNDSADAGENNECASPNVTASPLLNRCNKHVDSSFDNEHKDDKSLEIISYDNDVADSNGSHGTESVSDKQQTDVVCDNAFEVRDANVQCLYQVNDSDCSVPASSEHAEVLDSAGDAGEAQSQYNVLDASQSSPRPPSQAASDTETAEFDMETAEDKDLSTARFDENHSADTGNAGKAENQFSVLDVSHSSPRPSLRSVSDTEMADSDVEAAENNDLSTAKFDETADLDMETAQDNNLSVTKFDENNSADARAMTESQLQLECEDDEVKSAETENDDSVPTSSETVADSKDSLTLSTSQLSTVDVTTSSATSLSTVVVINTPATSSLNVSGLPAKVAVVAVTSDSDAPRPTQQSNRPLTVSTPAASVRSSSSSTRPVSRLLQDVGLLLVSQKVFKNLASVQKQKIADSKEKCDMELLQKLKTSHQNLVAKNHTLLMPELKCWCGFHSESVNVIEDHRVRCNQQGYCCYCRGRFVYRTEGQMMKHLWKVHRKVGSMMRNRAVNALPCLFCSVDFTSRYALMRHIDQCRRKFLLVSNLAPRDNDKDIPITAAIKQQMKQQVKQPVSIPVMVASSQMSPETVATTVSRNTPLTSPAIMPPVGFQLAPLAVNTVPAPKLIQIGQQLFTLLPPASVAAASTVAVNKVVGQVALNSVTQTAHNANSGLPVTVSNRSAKPIMSQASRLPASVVSKQYSTCQACGAFVRDKNALFVHMHVAHGATHKMCHFCRNPDITFPNNEELQSHIKKIHTSYCWICRSCFQPPDRLIDHIASRHKVTVAMMLEMLRCYFCAAMPPPLADCAAFEQHMIKMHSQQFPVTSKLWEYIVNSPSVNKNWYPKLNPDGTLECPHCLGQFISTSYLYRHLHLEHGGKLVKLVTCQECKKRMPSSDLLGHLTSAHTHRCSLRLSRVDVQESECVLVPPVGTKRKRNMKGEAVSSSHPRRLKRARTAETVIISDSDDDDDDDDDDDNVSESEEIIDDSSDEDFVLASKVSVEPRQQLRRSIHTRVHHRNSSVDDVHEVLESIVDSGHLETAAKPRSHFANSSVRRASISTSAAADFCNGITEDEVEIIESIVPTVQRRPVSRPEHTKPSDRNHVVTDSSKTTAISEAMVVHGSSSDRCESELAECMSGDCRQPPTTPTKSTVQQLMARDQIMVNSVEEVLEIDGETVLIVHDDDDDHDHDSDRDN